jgi:hypothetical protein
MKSQEVLREPSALRLDIREHLEKENAYSERILSPTKYLQVFLLQNTYKQEILLL